MRRRWIVIVTWLAVVACARDAQARLDVYVDKATQRMAVVQDGYMRYMWPVSTGRDGYSTPNGVYSPERLERSWFSREYYDAPMPYVIFFHNGHAIHGSYDLNRLGGPASHGCIRLYPQHAAVLFGMVEQEGPENTTIVVGDGAQPIPRAASPRSRGMDDLPGPVAPADGAIAKAAPPPRLRAAPLGDAGRNLGPPGGSGPLATQDVNRLPEPPGRPVGDNGQIGARGANQIREPRNAPSAVPDRSADAPSRRSDPRSDTAGSSLPPLPIPRRDPDSANDASKTSRGACDDPPEAAQAPAGYKVLPKSYWSGASWRWRWNGEPDER